jgi:hypothetical protein
MRLDLYSHNDTEKCICLTQVYDGNKIVTPGTHEPITKHTANITFLSHFWAWMKLVAMCDKHERAQSR